MIHVVTCANRSIYSETLAEMHRLRRVHFVEERGWAAMTVENGGEYDPYDDDLAVYLLAIEPDGTLSASMRMRPAGDGSVLDDVFPHLVAADEPPVAQADVWEISRYFASGRGRGRGGAKRRAEIRLAALEVALERGVGRLVGMIDLEILPAILDGSGWRVRPIGLPAPYAEGVAQAIEVEVSREALRDLCESQGLSAPLTLQPEMGWSPPLTPPEIEAVARMTRASERERRILLALIRRLGEVQETMVEDEQVRLVEAVQALVEGRDTGGLSA